MYKSLMFSILWFVANHTAFYFIIGCRVIIEDYLFLNRVSKLISGSHMNVPNTRNRSWHQLLTFLIKMFQEIWFREFLLQYKLIMTPCLLKWVELNFVDIAGDMIFDIILISFKFSMAIFSYTIVSIIFHSIRGQLHRTCRLQL